MNRNTWIIIAVVVILAIGAYFIWGQQMLSPAPTDTAQTEDAGAMDDAMSDDASE